MQLMIITGPISTPRNRINNDSSRSHVMSTRCAYWLKKLLFRFVSVLADPGVPTWLVPNSLVKWILRLGARGFVDKVMSVMTGCTDDPT